MVNKRIFIAALALGAALLGTDALDAQRRVPGERPDTSVPVTITLKAGADAYDFAGRATCTHAPVAGIYNLRAEQWRVEHSGDGRSLNLTHWHPASGADMFTLSLTAGGKRSAVNTVKVGSNGTVEGSGTVTLARAGKGGTFTVSATTGSGTKISGTIKCDAFAPAIAEGGE